MNEHWITVEEAADCCGIKTNSIVQQVKRGKVEYKHISGKGKGGKQLRILLESLPPEAQCRYADKRRQTTPREIKDMFLLRMSQDKRDELEEKLLITREYIKFRETCTHKDHVKRFVKYMKKNYPMYEFNPERLAKWASLYEQFGEAGLVDNRGKHNEKKTSLTKEMQDMFLKYYLTDKKPSIQKCYEAVSSYFDGAVPSISSFKRFLYTIPEPTLALYRGGQKYFSDNYLPSIQTDYDSVESNFEWIADHHKYDVIVNDNGKVGRAWLSTWLDRRSRYIVGYVINLCEPNADIVLNSFADAVHRCGLPKRIQIDNGKDYTVHDLFNTDSSYSLAAELKLKVRTSIPYNAKAKPIERAFRTIEHFNKMLDSYCGDRPEHRAESLGKRNDQIKDDVMTYEQFREIAKYVIDLYNNQPQTGQGMNGRTPAQCYVEEFKSRREMLADIELLHIMRRRTRTVTVTKNGVKFAELGRLDYYDVDFVMHHFGEKVYAKYFTGDVKTIHVYSAKDDTFLAVLPCKALFDYRAGAEVQSQIIRENERNKQKMRKFAKEHYPKIHVTPIEEVYRRRAESLEEPDFSQIPTTIHMDAEKRSEHRLIQEEETKAAETAMKKVVFPVEDDDDYNYEAGLSRRFANG